MIKLSVIICLCFASLTFASYERIKQNAKTFLEEQQSKDDLFERCSFGALDTYMTLLKRAADDDTINNDPLIQNDFSNFVRACWDDINGRIEDVLGGFSSDRRLLLPRGVAKLKKWLELFRSQLPAEAENLKQLLNASATNIEKRLDPSQNSDLRRSLPSLFGIGTNLCEIIDDHLYPAFKFVRKIYSQWKNLQVFGLLDSLVNQILTDESFRAGHLLLFATYCDRAAYTN